MPKKPRLTQKKPLKLPTYLKPKSIPRDSPAHNIALNLSQQLQQAVVLHQQGQLDTAQHLYEQILAIAPQYVDAIQLLATVYAQKNQPQNAVDYFERALALKACNSDLHSNYGVALQSLKRFEEALTQYKLAITLNPNFASAYNNRGNTLKELKRFDEALTAYGQAIHLNANYPDALYNRGNTFKELRRYTEAIASYDQAIALQPNYPDAYSNRGLALQKLMCIEAAAKDYDKAIQLDPNHQNAIWNKALLLILTGQYTLGWALYEARLKIESTKNDYYHFADKLAWRGQESIRNKKLLIYTEQGLGDMIQFCRYLPQLAALGAEIILEVRPSLVTFIATLNCPKTIVAKASPLPAFDAYCPVMSLPHVFNTTLETIPAEIPYLYSDPVKVQAWQAKLAFTQANQPNQNQLKVGLVWSGAHTHHNDINRSASFEHLLPLLKLPISWHSLQKDYRAHDLALLNEHPEVAQHQQQLHDFTDTAALIMCLDVVITVDTSVAHLAGALGKPVWILLPLMPEYRWLLNRSDTPWYPTARLFRQTRQDDWQSVVAQVAQALSQQWLTN